MRIQRYAIFDCTKADGYAATGVPFAWLAHVVARVLSRATGRFHDYDTDD